MRRIRQFKSQFNKGYTRLALALTLIPILTALLLGLFVLPFSGAVASPSPLQQDQYLPPELPPPELLAAFEEAAGLTPEELQDLTPEEVSDLAFTLNSDLLGDLDADQLANLWGSDRLVVVVDTLLPDDLPDLNPDVLQAMYAGLDLAQIADQDNDLQQAALEALDAAYLGILDFAESADAIGDTDFDVVADDADGSLVDVDEYTEVSVSLFAGMFIF